jgi:HK97 gp10 family phage protein
MADVRVLGIAQAVKNLQAMSVAIHKRVTRKAVRAATLIFNRAVKAGAYGTGRQKRTGLLMRSLGMVVSTKQRGLVVGKIIARPVDITARTKVAQAVRASRKFKANNATETAAFYWRFLEKGTGPRTTQGGASRGALSARPWVVPAFDANVSSALDRFASIFRDEVEAEARKLKQGVTR